MTCGRLHTEHRTSGILNELIQDDLIVVELLALESCKAAHADSVAVASHHGDRFKYVLALVAVHYHAALGLQFPGSLVDVQHYDVHTQVEAGFLGAQAGTQAAVEEHHQQGLVLAQCLVGERILLDVFGLGQSFIQRPDIFYISKVSHTFMQLVR